MAKRKRGELPSITEINASLKSSTHVVIKAEHRYGKCKAKASGVIKHIYVQLMDIENSKVTNWMPLTVARQKFGTVNKKRKSAGRHTDETISRTVTELTDGNANLISWRKGDNDRIFVKIQFNCGCIVEKQLCKTQTHILPECPICSGKWKTENAVCELVEKCAKSCADNDVIVTTNRQETVHILVDGKDVTRRFDIAVKIQHKEDPSINQLIYIEYNGECHYKPINYGNLSEEVLEEAFRQYQIRDRQKQQYCKENYIPLMTIPYWYKHRIEEMMDKYLAPKIFECAMTVVQLYWQNACRGAYNT